MASLSFWCHSWRCCSVISRSGPSACWVPCSVILRGFTSTIPTILRRNAADADDIDSLETMPRCPWATSEPNITYHDVEWGVPVHNDRLLFEFLILEGAQAGLSWTTILKKRANYRKAFHDFDPERTTSTGALD